MLYSKLNYFCHVAVSVLCLFLIVPWVGLQYVIGISWSYSINYSGDDAHITFFSLINLNDDSCFLTINHAIKILFNILSIVCGSSVFVFVLLCITMCPF